LAAEVDQDALKRNALLGGNNDRALDVGAEVMADELKPRHGRSPVRAVGVRLRRPS
jgi:hypothetical protein